MILKNTVYVKAKYSEEKEASAVVEVCPKKVEPVETPQPVRPQEPERPRPQPVEHEPVVAQPVQRQPEHRPQPQLVAKPQQLPAAGAEVTALGAFAATSVAIAAAAGHYVYARARFS